MSVVCSHRRNVDDVVTDDETEREEQPDEEPSPSGYWRRGGKYDYSPTVVERGGKPLHVLYHVLSLHATGIVDGPYLRYLSSGNRERGLELRQRPQSVVEHTVNVGDVDVDGPVRPSDIPLNAGLDLFERGVDCSRVAQVF